MSSSLPFVSVIVPVRNEEGPIADCLQSLLAQDYPQDRFEIIVVDDGSSDDTASVVRRFPVRYVRQRKKGASTARNNGFRRTRGEFIAFTDSDCAVPSNWLSQLVAVLSEDDSIEAAGGDSRISGGDSLLQDYLVYSGAYSQEEFFSSSSPCLPWLDTGNLMVRRRSLERVGGFEKSLFPGEDMDLSWRITLTGGRLQYLPDLHVEDKGPASLAEFYLQNFRSGGVSSLLNRRYRHLLRKDRKGVKELFRDFIPFLQKFKMKIFRLLFSKNSLSPARRITYLFFLITGHFAFRVGKLFHRYSIPTLPKSFYEDTLLYLCSFPHGRNSTQNVTARLLEEVKDWEGFLQKAIRHRLIPRLYSFLKQNRADSLLATPRWKTLEMNYWRNQAYVLALETELEELLPLFEKEGMNILLLKGAALSQTVFRENPVRFFVDLDLLIQPADWKRADALLKGQGYQRFFTQSPFPTLWHEEETRSWLPKIDSTYIHPEKQTNIDLHVALFEDPSFNVITADQLWRSAKRISMGESSAWLPDPTALFLHLLFHWAKHRMAGENVGGWFLDLHECLCYFEGEIDGWLCRETIEKSSLRERLFELLASIQFYFSSPLPGSLLKTIEQEGVEPFPLFSIFSPSLRPDLVSFNDAQWLDRRKQFLSNLQRIRGMGKKIFYILLWFFPDRKYFEDKYPFGNVLEKAGAYGRHWAMMAGKGIGIGLYLIQRGWGTRRILQKEEKSVY